MDTVEHNKHNAKGNTSLRARGWCFTLNNYDDRCSILDTLKSVSEKYIFGFEVAPSTGTRHIQGYVYFTNARTFEQVKDLIPGAHIEKAKGSPKHNITYCSKGGIYDTNMQVDENEYVLEVITNLFPWQRRLEDIILTKPDGRSIYWIWEGPGNVGKTSFIKYILNKYQFCEFSRATKSADIVTIANRSKTCYIFDFARTQENFSPYIALEQLKDGLITDSKLKKESRNIIMNCPHVFCFANWPPNKLAMSLDRWKVFKIEGENLIEDISPAVEEDLFKFNE